MLLSTSSRGSPTNAMRPIKPSICQLWFNMNAQSFRHPKGNTASKSNKQQPEETKALHGMHGTELPSRAFARHKEYSLSIANRHFYGWCPWGSLSQALRVIEHGAKERHRVRAVEIAHACRRGERGHREAVALDGVEALVREAAGRIGPGAFGADAAALV